jgi:non-homologous end joining protein Ku
VAGQASRTQSQVIAFGDYEIAVSLSKANGSRDIKTEYVNEAGETVTMSGGRGGSRTPAPGVQKAVRLTDTAVVRLPADELDVIVAESKDRWSRMRVLESMDYRQVPTERIVASYWIAPAQASTKALLMLAEGLRRSGRVLVVQWCASSREKLGVIRVRHPDRSNPAAAGKIALMLSELTFANDFREATPDALAINDVELDDPAVVDAAVRLIESFGRERGDERRIDTASDTAVDARIALVERLAEQQGDEAVAALTGEAVKEPVA